VAIIVTVPQLSGKRQALRGIRMATSRKSNFSKCLEANDDQQRGVQFQCDAHTLTSGSECSVHIAVAKVYSRKIVEDLSAIEAAADRTFYRKRSFIGDGGLRQPAAPQVKISAKPSKISTEVHICGTRFEFGALFQESLRPSEVIVRLSDQSEIEDRPQLCIDVIHGAETG